MVMHVLRKLLLVLLLQNSGVPILGLKPQKAAFAPRLHRDAFLRHETNFLRRLLEYILDNVHISYIYLLYILIYICYKLIRNSIKLFFILNTCLILAVTSSSGMVQPKQPCRQEQ